MCVDSVSVMANGTRLKKEPDLITGEKKERLIGYIGTTVFDIS
jgi:hypothetical protein